MALISMLWLKVEGVFVQANSEASRVWSVFVGGLLSALAGCGPSASPVPEAPRATGATPTAGRTPATAASDTSSVKVYLKMVLEKDYGTLARLSGLKDSVE